MEKDEFAKLLALLKKINELVKTSYTTNNPCIIYEGTKVPSSSLDEKNIF
jgi:hypothetical protein